MRTLGNWKKRKIIEAQMCPDYAPILLEMPLKVVVSGFMGYLTGKAA